MSLVSKSFFTSYRHFAMLLPVTSEKRAQKFHTDDVYDLSPLRRLPLGIPIKIAIIEKKKNTESPQHKETLQRRKVQYPDLCIVVLLIDRRCREENLRQPRYPANSPPGFSPTSPVKGRQVGERTWERGCLDNPDLG